MRLVALVLPLLLLSACNGVIPSGDGRYTSNATATSDNDNPRQRAHDQAEAFCRKRGKPLVIESTAGGIRPRPESWTVSFRCGYPAADVAPTPVPAPVHAPTPAVPDSYPEVSQDAGQPPPSIPPPVAATRRYAVVVSFASLAEGPDPVAHASFETEMKSLEKELGRTLERHVVHWGREGEFNVCMDLAEASAWRRHAFVRKLREHFRNSDRTGLAEDAECGD